SQRERTTTAAAGARTTIDNRVEPDAQRPATGLRSRPGAERRTWGNYSHSWDGDEADPGWRPAVAPGNTEHHRHNAELHRRVGRFQWRGPRQSVDPFRGDIDNRLDRRDADRQRFGQGS